MQLPFGDHPIVDSTEDLLGRDNLAEVPKLGSTHSATC
jgi:hypothetical protein